MHVYGHTLHVPIVERNINNPLYEFYWSGKLHPIYKIDNYETFFQNKSYPQYLTAMSITLPIKMCFIRIET